MYTALSGTVRSWITIDTFYRSCSGTLPALTQNARPLDVWKEGLDNLAAAGLVRELCLHLLADSDIAAIHPQITAVDGASSVLEQLTLELTPGIDRHFVNRKKLRTELEKVSAPQSPVGVLLVRGNTKSGRSWTRHMVDRRAHELNEGPIVYLCDINAARVERVLRAIFIALDPGGRINTAINSTDTAWMDEVIQDMHAAAPKRGRRLWIVMDDLGEVDGAPKVDKQIRVFFEQFALNMINPEFAQYFRLVLLDYPLGKLPSKWNTEISAEDNTDDAKPGKEELIEYITHWAKRKGKNVFSEDIEAKAADILAKANASAQAKNEGLWVGVYRELGEVLSTL